MARVYNPNFDGFRKMANGPEIRAVLAEVAEKAKTIAEGLSQDFRITGEYAESFVVGEETVVFPRGPRAAATLTNTAPYAAAVEWGYKGRANEPDGEAHRVLGRTLDALGNG